MKVIEFDSTPLHRQAVKSCFDFQTNQPYAPEQISVPSLQIPSRMLYCDVKD